MPDEIYNETQPLRFTQEGSRKKGLYFNCWTLFIFHKGEKGPNGSLLVA
jgi:hypothetical protein